VCVRLFSFSYVAGVPDSTERGARHLPLGLIAHSMSWDLTSVFSPSKQSHHSTSYCSYIKRDGVDSGVF